MENDPYNKGDFINYYNEDNIEDYYLLDEENKIYKECYKTCQTCFGFGYEEDHKCSTCKYLHYPDKDNCHPQCDGYYYFTNDDVFHCVKTIPKGYMQIYDQPTLIKTCEEYLTYEYNNICYPRCPGYTVKTNDFKCVIDCKANDKYFNYEQTDCINSIPEGYYCNNQEKNTIEKCHQNCKSCEQGGTNDNNNCLVCKDGLFYDLGNCKSNCVNGELNGDDIKKCKCTQNKSCEKCSLESNEEDLCITCNNQDGYYMKADDEFLENGFVKCYENPEGYFLKDNKYHKCYSTCKKCNSLGDNLQQECTECLDNYEYKKDFDNDTNCYQKCEFNYYYEPDRNLICTSDNKCPEQYPKLVVNKSRCIDDCKKDNENQYEFENKCYSEPPPNTRPSSEDPYYCIAITQPDDEKDKCNLKSEELDVERNKLTNEILAKYVSEFNEKYNFFKDYVNKLENDYYKILIYDNVKCLEETSKEAPISNFDSCVKKVKTKFEIKLDLINIIVMIKDKNDKITNTSFAFGDPITGELLDIGDTCSNENIEIAKDLVNMIEELEIDNQQKEILVDLVKQGINVFDPNDKFFQDLCYYYDSPIKKDIPMRDRVSLYYPNLTLCESGCTENGIDYNE